MRMGWGVTETKFIDHQNAGMLGNVFHPTTSNVRPQSIRGKKTVVDNCCVFSRLTGFRYGANSFTSPVMLLQPEHLVFADLVKQCPLLDDPDILDNLYIDDPLSNLSHPEIKEPEFTQTTKLGRQILKIRRKKMKRHLLKKYRKRMVFTLRKQRRERQRKKEAVFLETLAKIEQWGETFSAKEYVLEELKQAKRGGFYINILDKR